MPTSPQVLAAFAKTHLHIVRGSGESLAARVCDSSAPESLAAIEDCARISWVPMEHHVALNEALFAEAGSTRARELCRLAVLESFDQPFLRPLFKGAIAVLGKEFGRFAGWAPKAWMALFRHAGEMRWFLESETEGRLELSDAAACILASPAYVEGLAGGFAAMFEATGRSGEVTGTTSGADVAFSFRWHD